MNLKYFIVTFEELNLSNPLINALTDLGYTNPTPIQEQAFPVVMSGKDVIGVAQTGTGKTFAYLLPLLRQLKFSENKHPRILIVVPTRELVLQVVGEIEKLTKYINLRFTGVYGGTNIKTQGQVVYNGLDVLVATPGRLYDLNLAGILRLHSIQKLVIDEVDEMLNLGFRPQLLSLMETLPPRRQNLMFSATLNSEIEELINDFFYDTEKIEIAPHGTPLDKIIQKGYHVPNFNTKVNLLELLLSVDTEMEKVLVFVNNKRLADRLHENLVGKISDKIGVIHSNKSQNLRFRTLRQFHEGESKILIATDIVARGLDISDVTHVVNFDIPEYPADYIHRIGRTGRAEKDGIAISFINEAEQVYQEGIEKLMEKNIPMEQLPENLEISTVYTEEERPKLYDKNYLRVKKVKEEKGASFHEKKEKNLKQNSGSPSQKDPKKHNRTKGGKRIK